MPAIYQVDAFADRPFTGNPAAVCLLDSKPTDADPDDAWLQHVAAEMNLAETAFVRRAESGFDLRWMTPKVEVDLCGHATLAAAHILWEYGHAPAGGAITFFTRSGTLTAQRIGSDIQLDFPQKPATAASPPPLLFEALGIDERAVQFTGKNEFDWLIELADGRMLRSLQPDFRQLAGIAMRGVIVTALDDAGEFDFLSRFFAPAAGIDEDPVTGSAHVCLGPHWQPRLDKNPLRGYQASARGGTVAVQVTNDRCLLAGNAITMLEGMLTC